MNPGPFLPVLLSALALTGCGGTGAPPALPARVADAPGAPLQGPFVHEAALMGSRFRISLYAPDAATAREAAQTAFRSAQAVNDLLSDYQNDSENLQLCALPHGLPHPVSEAFAEALGRSLDLAAQTGGAFDPTVGPVSQLWRRARMGKPMDWKELERRQPAVGWQKVTLDRAARTVTLAVPGMRLDFGGIGKGWAADVALKVLRSKGLPHASVAASGDLAIGDPPPGKTGWTVGIESIDASGGAVTTEVELHNCGLSTSGDTEQFLELEGKRYSHILDPHTGLALTERRGVSVAAPNATLSDALATAFCVMGPAEGKKWAETHGVGAFFVTVQADGSKNRQATRDWPRFARTGTPPATR